MLTASLLVSVLLSACSEPVIPVGPDTGSLEVSIVGLPAEAKAQVLVSGPEDYRESVTANRTLSLRSGTYTLAVDTVTFAGESFTGRVVANARSSTIVDVAVGETVTVAIRYSSVGVVGAGEIAPGITRAGEVSEAAFDDYAFQGEPNVPLAFDFTGTGEKSNGSYTVSIYRAGALGEALVDQRFTTYGSDGLIGFSPPEAGRFVLRIRGQGEVVDYRVRASYLNGPPEARGAITLELSEMVSGTVTRDSYDLYRVSSPAGEPLTLDFATKTDDQRYNGFYTVSLYRVGETVPLETFPLPPQVSYGSFGYDPEIRFDPPAAGDYLVRVTGVGTAGTSIVRYSVTLERAQ